MEFLNFIREITCNIFEEKPSIIFQTLRFLVLFVVLNIVSQILVLY